MKYNVYVWYATCVQVETEDEDDEDIVRSARAMLDDMDDKSFRDKLEFSEFAVDEVELQ